MDEFSHHQKLLKSIAENDRAAFRELYDLYKSKVFNTATSYLQNKEDAEEVTQNVFVKIHKNAAKFRGDSAVSTWIYRITVNASLNHIQSKKRFSFLPFSKSEKEKPDFDHPEILMEKKENAQALFAAIDKLPESQKSAFILSFIEELPRQEVADILEISLKATESLLQRAKQNLRKHLGKMYPERRKK